MELKPDRSYAVQLSQRGGLCRLLVLLVVSLATLLTRTGPVAAAAAAAGDEVFARQSDVTYLCPLSVVRRSPGLCPPFGPGTQAVRIAHLRARLPDPLPELPVEALPKAEGSVTQYVYGRIATLPAPTYRHPAEAAAGMPPLRTFLSNINWVSVRGTVSYEGQEWLQINTEETILASAVDFPEASRFQGVRVTEQPAYPFAWLRRDLHPSASPGGPGLEDVALPLRSLVTVFATTMVGGKQWDMVDDGQWIPHDWVAQATPTAPPAGVPTGAKWLRVDTYEQTIAAYEGERMVYATLITSGKADLTPLGLFQIHRKVRAALMESWDRPMDDEYWFYLEDVEHAQFFNDRISLHAAYWHDYFGTSRSNGCVNLAPLDARWLYDWTDPPLPPGGSWSTPESAGEGQTWVWVVYPGGDVPQKPRP